MNHLSCELGKPLILTKKGGFLSVFHTLQASTSNRKRLNSPFFKKWLIFQAMVFSRTTKPKRNDKNIHFCEIDLCYELVRCIISNRIISFLLFIAIIVDQPFKEIDKPAYQFCRNGFSASGSSMSTRMNKTYLEPSHSYIYRKFGICTRIILISSCRREFLPKRSWMCLSHLI